MIKVWTLSIIFMLSMVFICQKVASQTDFNHYQLDTTAFKLRELDQRPLLVLPDGGEIAIPKDWLYPLKEVEEEQDAYVSSFNFLAPITSFQVSEDLVGLHLSSWDSMAPGAGSAMAASGRDVFLVYHKKTGALSLGFPDLHLVKSRTRAMGCYFSTFRTFIIGDINTDGFTDIGMVQEKIWCELISDEEREMDIMQGPYYKKYPIEWYVSRIDKWERAPRFNGGRPKKAERTLPLIGLEKSPVEFVREIYKDRRIELK